MPSRGRTLYYDVTQAERPLLGSYEVCFLVDVIEHVPEPRALLAAGHLRRYSRHSLAKELEEPDGDRGLMA